MTKNVSKQINNIDLCIDYRLELLGIMQTLTYMGSENNFIDVNESYTKQIITRFSKFKNHNIISLFKEIIEKHDFSYDAPVSLFLQLDDNFTGENLDNDFFKNRFNNNSKIYEFLSQLKPFVEEIEYDKFYDENKNYYEECLNNFSYPLEKYNILDCIEQYTGIDFKGKECHVCLMPFQHSNCYSVYFQNQLYCCLSCRDSDTKEYIQKQAIGTFNCLVHEFSHSIINPITDKLNLIPKNDNIFENIMPSMEQADYGCNSSIINEHIIRALTLRYIKQYVKNEESYLNYIKSMTDYEISKGFIYIENIVESLIKYEDNRDKYSNIEEFYPTIIRNLKTHTKQKEQGSLENKF